MKALILAAGYGTRLLPFTNDIPKPLFTLDNTPMIAYAINALEAAGCSEIYINTHHLNKHISSFVEKNTFEARISIIHEQTILNTGGAIANIKNFIGQEPFYVVNADVISSVDLKAVYEDHLQADSLATLVLHDYQQFNKVEIDEKGYVRNFDSQENALAFTGIQILSPEIFDHFPRGKVFSSIDVYKKLCSDNQIRTFVAKKLFWSDIGTPESYIKTSMQILSAKVLQCATNDINQIKMSPVTGDGSDRKWHRASYDSRTCIICDHGINLPSTAERKEVDAFINIGRHCLDKGLNLPRIFNYDLLSGVVVLEDLGDLNLQTITKKNKHHRENTISTYKSVIELLIDFSQSGIEAFKPEWTYQSTSYSKELIINNECFYFTKAFINQYMNKEINSDRLIQEFSFIADNALEHGLIGLMHRDFQSRNIMILDSTPYFIDFQGARSGPIQYDLASLLIDPYVNLNDDIKDNLLEYSLDVLKITDKNKREEFLTSYNYCCLTRNLQILGAFAFLSQVKNKSGFEKYIPDAVISLKKIIRGLNNNNIHYLSNLVETL